MRMLITGYKDPGFDLVLLKMFLWQYIDGSGSGWIYVSLKTAHTAERGPWLARRLWEWTRAYIAD